MAFSSRLKAAVQPLYQTVKVVSPTAIGVMLSLGVHAVFFAFGPRTNFSFAALSAAAQQEEAEETIVPIVQLTPAERSRLPAFAQPRVLPPSPTGLNDGLGLPFNLSSPNSNRQIQRRPVPAGRLPSPTLPSRPTLAPSFRVPRTTFDPSAFRNLPSPSVVQRPRVSVLPPPATTLPNVTPSNPSADSENADSLDQATLPDLLGTGPTPSAQDLQTSPRSIGDILNTAEDNLSSGGVASSEGTSGEGAEESSSEEARSPDDIENAATQPQTEPTDIAVQPPNPIDTAPAQGDTSRLLAGFVYDPTDVSEAEAEINLQAWLEKTAENKSEIDSQKASITIDSNFKVCKDNPPTDGLIGIVVNPDGSKEETKVLKSIGYDVLNRQAIDEIERTDFDQTEVPTQYQVTVEVLYRGDGCVEELPEATEDIDG
ncbi:MAG: hypothetical protein AAF716_05465 [Cyanobacteria bacterium P01_D01_bin.1]